MNDSLEPEPVTEGICWLCLEEGHEPKEVQLFKTPLSGPECLGHARASWRDYLGLMGGQS